MSASLPLSAMVGFAVAMGRSKRDRHAVEHPRTCERLANRIDDWQDIEPHESFLGRLRAAFGQRWSFWRQLKC